MKLSGYIFISVLLLAYGCATPRHTEQHASSKGIEGKYAKMLGVGAGHISNKKLYAFIDEWYGAPYKYAGKTKKGIDCSGFICVLFREIYGRELSGSSASLYKQCQSVSKNKLQEGDLVFFKIDSKDVSHVGIYLQNNKFVHATTKAGVMIDDLNADYYKKHFFESGRLD